jgi:hypothetical protein
MGLQISCGLHFEAAQEGDIWRIAQAPWKDIGELAFQRKCKVIEGHLMPD